MSTFVSPHGSIGRNSGWRIRAGRSGHRSRSWLRFPFDGKLAGTTTTRLPLLRKARASAGNFWGVASSFQRASIVISSLRCSLQTLSSQNRLIPLLHFHSLEGPEPITKRRKSTKCAPSQLHKPSQASRHVPTTKHCELTQEARKNGR